MTFDFPKNAQVDKYLSATGTNWATWNKPLGFNNVTIIAVGTGNPGGSSSGNTGGGAGGNTGGFGILTCPMYLIPDTLYVQIGISGTIPGFGSAGLANCSSLPTYIARYPDSTNSINILMSCNNSTPNSFGTTAAGGTVTNFNTSFAIASWVQGNRGGGGGTLPNPGGNSFPNSGNPIYGGGGGGGAAYVGPPTILIGNSFIPSQFFTATEQSTTSTTMCWKPFTVFGGGGGNNVATFSKPGFFAAGAGGSQGPVGSAPGGSGFVFIISY